MQDAIDALVKYAADLLAALSKWVGDQITSLIGWVQGMITTIKTLMSDVVTSIKAFMSSLMTQLSDAVGALILQVKTAFQEIANFVGSLINPIITELKSFLANTYNSLRDIITYVINTLSGWIVNAFDFLVRQIQEIAGPIITWINEVAGKVKAFVDTALDDLKAGYTEVVRLIKQSYEDLLGGSNSLIGAIENRLHGIGTAFNDAAVKAGDLFKQGITDAAQPLTDAVKKIVEPFKEFIDPAEKVRLESALERAFKDGGLYGVSIEGAKQSIQQLVPTTWLGMTLFNLFTAFGLTLKLYGGITEAQSQLVLQEFSRNFHYQLLSPADSAQATLRGALPRNKAVDNIVRAGFSPENAELILDNATTVPPVGEVLAMLRRGLIKQEDYQEAIQRLGLPILYEGAYQQLSNVIPPIGDLITMAVKGAFSQEETSRFRTDEDFPQSIVESAKQQGLSEEWMRRYWRAHWNLPSPGQGFEMFQRGIIGREELDVLMKALDITPYWRDLMVKLNYNVLTRVDVRRMHQLGMMDRAGLVKAHQDMGYSPDDADKLATFVEDLNKGKPGPADEELGRLSRTNVMNFYQDGTITKDRAIELLVNIGYDPDAALLFIETADFEAERVQRNAEIEFIIANVTAGNLSFEQGQDELASLHLSPTELSRASAKITREATRATKLPTVEQGTKMYQAGIIPEPQFANLLSRLGYRAEWRDALIALAKSETKKKV